MHGETQLFDRMHGADLPDSVRRQADAVLGHIHAGLESLGISNIAEFIRLMQDDRIDKETSAPIVSYIERFRHMYETGEKEADWNDLEVISGIEIAHDITHVAGALSTGALVADVAVFDNAALPTAGIINPLTGDTKFLLDRPESHWRHPFGITARDHILVRDPACVLWNTQTHDMEYVTDQTDNSRLLYNAPTDQLLEHRQGWSTVVMWDMTNSKDELSFPLPRAYNRIYGITASGILAAVSMDGVALELVDTFTHKVVDRLRISMYQHVEVICVGEHVIVSCDEPVWHWSPDAGKFTVVRGAQSVHGSFDATRMHLNLYAHPQDQNRVAFVGNEYKRKKLRVMVADLSTNSVTGSYDFSCDHLAVRPDGKMIGVRGKQVRIIG